MPVLYGKNTILYSCNVSIFNPYDSSKVGFPDQYIKQIKHLHLKAQPKYGAEGGVPIDVGAAVQHFADRGCEVETFELSLKRDGRYGDQDNYTASEDAAQWLSVHSRELLTALVGLTVSKSLTISLSFSQKGVVNLTAVSGLFRDRLIKRLASHKEFTFTEEEDFDAEFLGDRRKSDKELSDKEVSEDCEDGGDGEEDGSEHTAYESEYFNEDDEDSYLIWYWSKWCLRPQHSKAQKDSASA